MSAPATGTALGAALTYAAKGLPVLPLHWLIPIAGRGYTCHCSKLTCESRGKHPFGRLVPNGLRQASTDERTIKHWFFTYPDINIAIATGETVALDVDPRHGGDESLRRLEAEHGPLPPTWRTITGGGGEHIFFTPSRPIQNSADAVGRGLDIRGTGGYVVAPPSLHESGRRYEWNIDAHPDETPLAAMPDWLEALASKQTSAGSTTDWSEFATTKIGEGARNGSLAKLTGHLLRKFVDPRLVAELVTSWNSSHCEPPLPQDEVLTIIQSIKNREFRRRENEHSSLQIFKARK